MSVPVLNPVPVRDTQVSGPEACVKLRVDLEAQPAAETKV